MNFFRIFAFAAFLPLFGCAPDSKEGSGCTYVETHGVCTFVDAVGGADVTFDFVSDDGALSDTSMLQIGDGGSSPTQDCLDELGITPGLEVGCTHGAIDEGTCSPVVYTFDDFETNACLD